MKTAACKAFPTVGGTLLPIDRIDADRPFHSGKHRKHGSSVKGRRCPAIRSADALLGSVRVMMHRE